MIWTALLGALALFDGSTLTGWSAQGPDIWRVEANELVASGDEDSYLMSADEFGNFTLALEFRVDAGVNSGVFIRCQQRDRIHPSTCYELNIWDEHPRQEARTGAIVFRFMPPLAKVHTLSGWNRMQVIVRGQNLELRVNGTTTALLDDADLASGFIALQHFGSGVVRFRNIELQPLED
ncbi:MAG: DUF1080 domain-containing protein [Pseudomonadota bacterium]